MATSTRTRGLSKPKGFSRTSESRLSNPRISSKEEITMSTIGGFDHPPPPTLHPSRSCISQNPSAKRESAESIPHTSLGSVHQKRKVTFNKENLPGSTISEMVLMLPAGTSLEKDQKVKETVAKSNRKVGMKFNPEYMAKGPPDYVTIAVVVAIFMPPLGIPCLCCAIKSRQLDRNAKYAQAWLYSNITITLFFACMGMFVLILIGVTANMFISNFYQNVTITTTANPQPLQVITLIPVQPRVDYKEDKMVQKFLGRKVVYDSGPVTVQPNKGDDFIEMLQNKALEDSSKNQS